MSDPTKTKTEEAPKNEAAVTDAAATAGDLTDADLGGVAGGISGNVAVPVNTSGNASVGTTNA